MNLNQLLLLLTLTFSGLMISACIGIEEPEPPQNLISESKYVDILVQLQHVKTWKNARPDSVNADSLTNLIYSQYQVEENQFLESHKYYQQQVEEQLVRIEEAIKRMENEKQMVDAYIDSVISLQPQNPDSSALQDSL